MKVLLSNMDRVFYADLNGGGRRAAGSGRIADHADPGEQYGIFHQLQEPGAENGIETTGYGDSRADEFYKINR